MIQANLSREGVTRSASACAFRIAALNHKVRDNPMKSQAIVKTALG